MGKIYQFETQYTTDPAETGEIIEDAKVIPIDSKRQPGPLQEECEEDIIDAIRKILGPATSKRTVLESVPTDEEVSEMESDDCVRFVSSMQSDVEANRPPVRKVKRRTNAKRSSSKRKPRKASPTDIAMAMYQGGYYRKTDKK
jgi:hypothetical protein